MTSTNAAGQILEWIRAKRFADGEQLPAAAELSRKLGMSRDAVNAALATLVERDRVSKIGARFFIGGWDTLSNPGFAKPFALRRALGEHYSIRNDFPERWPPSNCVTITDSSLQTPLIHTHDFCEVAVVREGTAIHLHGAARYPIRTGDCFAVLPGQPHAYCNSERLTVTAIMFMPEDMTRVAPQLVSLPGFKTLFGDDFSGVTASSLSRVKLSLARQNAVGALAANMQRSLESREECNYLEAFTYAVQMLILICRAPDSQRGNARSVESGRAQETVERVIAFLEANYANEVTVEQIARTVCLSVSRLQHLFKQTTGIALYEYLIGLRISEACRLLACTTTPLARIAGILGIHKQSHFSEQFKTRTGLSPSVYRRMHAVKARVLVL